MTWKIEPQSHGDYTVNVKRSKAIMLHVQSGKRVIVTYKNHTCNIVTTTTPRKRYQQDENGRTIRFAPMKEIPGHRTTIHGTDAIRRYLCERFGLYNGTLLMEGFIPMENTTWQHTVH